MLGETLAARIPLITVRTTDPVSVGSVLQYYTDKTPKVLKSVEVGDVSEGTTFVCHGKLPGRIDATVLYVAMANAGTTAVIVNPEKPIPMSFDAGVMDTPPKVICNELVNRCGIPEEMAFKLVESLEGLTPLECRWLIALVQSQEGKLTAATLRHARIQQSPPTRGLVPVSTEIDFYMPDHDIETWLKESGPFIGHSDLRLRPRGLMFKGMPGTGKTMGAKHIARSLDLPLYRLEVGSVKSKYVGESERILREALAAADRHAPIVLLVDEVEKVLAQSSAGDAGTTSALLGMLLWWLQEHRSSVLTVMTTNNIDKLPPELYRPGRIDVVLDVPPLKGSEEIRKFLRRCFATFDMHDPEFLDHAFHALHLPAGTGSVTHAELTAHVINLVKQSILAGTKWGSKARKEQKEKK
jgi:hypothetical protein